MTLRTKISGVERAFESFDELLPVLHDATDINLDYCELRNEEAAKLAEAIETNTSIKKLSLVGNNIGDVGASALANALETNSVLESLNLAGQGSTIPIPRRTEEILLGNDASSAFAAALSVNQTLRNLDLSNNAITPRGLFMWPTVDGNEHPALKSLDLTRNPIDRNGSGEEGDTVEDAVNSLKEIARIRSLTSLSYSSAALNIKFPGSHDHIKTILKTNGITQAQERDRLEKEAEKRAEEAAKREESATTPATAPTATDAAAVASREAGRE